MAAHLRSVFNWKDDEVAGGMASLFPGGQHEASSSALVERLCSSNKRSSVLSPFSGVSQSGIYTNIFGTSTWSMSTPGKQPAGSSPFASAQPGSASVPPAAALASAPAGKAEGIPALAEEADGGKTCQKPADAIKDEANGEGAAEPVQSAEAAQDTQLQPQSRRGRPPRVEGAYSRDYIAVKKYRQKKKDKMHALEEEIADKLQQVKLLQAENDNLIVREKVLQDTIQAHGKDLLQLEAEVMQLQQQRQQHSGDSACSKGDSGGNSASITSPWCSGSGTPADSSTEAEEQPTPRMREFQKRYCAYIDDAMRNRCGQDGDVRPLPKGDPRHLEMQHIVEEIMTMPSQESYRLLSMGLTPFVKGEPMTRAEYVKVAKQLQLTPEQQARVLKAWQTFETSLERLLDERRVLCAQLAGLQWRLEQLPVDTPACDEYELAHSMQTGISSMLMSEDNEDIVMALDDNMNRETQQWGIMSWSLVRMIEEHQVTHVCILCHPKLPSMSLVFAAYVVEVLGHKPLI